MTRSRLGLAVGLLLAAGLALRLFSAVSAYRVGPTRGDLYWDPDGYDRMGLQLLDRGALLDLQGQPLTDREPGLPVLLAGAHAVFGRSFAVAVGVSVALGVLGCWLVFGLTRELFGEAAALWALAAACLYPEWIYYCAFAYREPLEICLLVGWLWLWQSYRGKSDWRPFAAMGLLFGLLGLVRSTFLPLGGVFLLFVAWAQRRKAVKAICAFTLCAGLLNGLWILRNYRVSGHFVAGASMGGRMMYLSLQKDYSRPEEPLEAGLSDPNDPVFRQTRDMTPAQAQPYYYRASRDILFHEPGRFWSAFAHKVAKLWRPYPSGAWSYGHRFGLIMAAGLLSNVPLLALGLLGAGIAWRRRAPIGFLVSIPTIMTVIYGLFWAVTRFHTPLMAMLMPLAGLAVSSFLPRVIH